MDDHDDCLDSVHTAAGILSVQGTHIVQQLPTIIAIWGTGMLLNDIELDLHTVTHRQVLEIPSVQYASWTTLSAC